MENSEIYLDSFIFYNWFGLFADHCVDASEDFYHTANTSRLHNKTLTPNKVEKGDVIFVKTDYVYDGTFQEDYLPHISSPFILITGTSSYQVSNGCSIDPILQHPFLIKWFCTNAPAHAKIVPLPIGFQEKERPGGNQESISERHANKTPFERKKDRILLPYHIIHPPHSPEGKRAGESRVKAIEQLSSLPFVDSQPEKLPWKDYMVLLDKYKFVMCLEGTGPDIHRNYEALALHCVPINIKTIMENLFSFHRLPGLFFSSWDHLNEDKFRNYVDFNYNFGPVDVFLKVKYHADLIKKLQNENRGF